jgi:hypothetical protein
VAPIVLAVAILIVAIGVVRFLSPPTAFTCSIVKTEILPNVSVFKADSMVVAPQHTEYTLFVVATLHAEDKRLTATSLNDSSLTLTDANDGELTVKALYASELANAELSFPKLKPLAGTLLQRDTAIAPGRSAEGTVVFSLPLPESVWTHRKSAVIEVEPYHLDPITLTIPK